MIAFCIITNFMEELWFPVFGGRRRASSCRVIYEWVMRELSSSGEDKSKPACFMDYFYILHRFQRRTVTMWCFNFIYCDCFSRFNLSFCFYAQRAEKNIHISCFLQLSWVNKVKQLQQTLQEDSTHWYKQRYSVCSSLLIRSHKLKNSSAHSNKCFSGLWDELNVCGET